MDDLPGAPNAPGDRPIGAFAEPPLLQAADDGWLGARHTAVYDPVKGEVEFRWPSVTWRQSFENIDEGLRTVRD